MSCIEAINGFPAFEADALQGHFLHSNRSTRSPAFEAINRSPAFEAINGSPAVEAINGFPAFGGISSSLLCGGLSDQEQLTAVT